mmetsp:Transcript_1202/g.1916  ORF Transcript_1202/g.1916 Transcript_1202/m.1916 type:complete len:288 (-) Transcript_1202:39-902(-)
MCPISAKEYWDKYFEMTDIDQWVHDRSLFYRLRILGKTPENEEEEEILTTVHYPDILAVREHRATTHSSVFSALQTHNPSRKENPKFSIEDLHSKMQHSFSVSLPEVPLMAAPSQIAWIHKALKESTDLGRNFSGYLCQFFLALKRGIIEEKGFRHFKWVGVIIIDVFRMAFHSFLLFKKSVVGTTSINDLQQLDASDDGPRSLLEAKRILSTFDNYHALHHPAYPLCSDLRRFLKLIPIPDENMWELEEGIRYVLGKSNVTDADVTAHFQHAPKIPAPSDGSLKIK